jgi:hypothetical protein
LSVLELAAGRAGRAALAGDGHAAHAEIMEIALDARFAVAAVGGDRVRCVSGAPGDPFDRPGASCVAPAAFPISIVWSRMTPSALSTIRAL